MVLFEIAAGSMVGSTTVHGGSFHLWKVCEEACQENYRGERLSSESLPGVKGKNKFVQFENPN